MRFAQQNLYSWETMTATAAEVVSMERAALETPNSQAYLAPTINAFTATKPCCIAPFATCSATKSTAW